MIFKVEPPVRYACQVPLAPFTTFRIGGPADVMLYPESSLDWQACLRWCQNEGLPITLLGGGANVLISDQGVEGAVLLTTGMSNMEWRESDVTAEAGVTVNALVSAAVERGYSGIETFYGLPGTVGGAIVMNARCYGHSFCDRLISVTALTESGILETRQPATCEFSYKKSCFQSGRCWLARAVLHLDTHPDPDALRCEMQSYHTRREQAGQYRYPNAGCIFQNDYTMGIPAGQIIDQCALKGCSRGDAVVDETHANFILNRGSATANDVLSLIQYIEETVKEKKGVLLCREVRLLGRW